jgi:hypothetical protein
MRHGGANRKYLMWKFIVLPIHIDIFLGKFGGSKKRLFSTMVTPERNTSVVPADHVQYTK